MLKKMGKYELIEQVGRGAMGEVYKAQDPFIGRLVALKTITGALTGRPDLLERFYQEARSAGTLQHPNIVTVYELGKESDTPFIAMEFIEGESLEGMIERRPVLTLTQKVSYIIPVCRALDYAHKRGVVHRDIKPGNVMITKDGGVKVVDFGIARLMDSSHTQTNTIIGTLGYMSPQQIRGERADERSDIWACGVMLYELLTFQRPFDGANQTALMLNIASDDVKPAPLKNFVPDCPPAIEALLDKMLKKDITQRYQTMEEVLFDFEPIWRRLQEASVAEMIAGTEELIRAKQYTRARDVLRRALQIDSRNSRAKTLLEEVNGELRQTVVQSQVNAALERARQFLAEGRHNEAKSEAEAALKLDPENAPAKEIIADAERAAERARKIDLSLRTAKQKLAEGALEEAAEQARQVLDWESENPLARALQKQIDEQIAQRESRKRLADVLQKARKLWADHNLDEYTALLAETQKEFASEPEIARLVDMGKQERAEQRKRKLLADAKALLADQRFDDAVAAADAIAKEYPGDDATKKLREMILEEQENLARHRKLQKDIADLQSLVNSEKYSEAVFRGEKLLREYPKHAELFDLMNFARAEAAKLEQRRLAAEALKDVDAKVRQSKFQDAIGAAEKALARFPRDPGLESALEQARAGLKEVERKGKLRQRAAEIQAKMKAGQHSAAADLARQAIATLGSDPDLEKLLREAEAAEAAAADKRAKEQAQERERASKVSDKVAEVQTVVQTMIADGRFGDATQILQNGLATQLFSKKDPRVEELFRELDKKGAATASASGKPPAEAPESPATTAPVGPPAFLAETIISLPADKPFSATIVAPPSARETEPPLPAEDSSSEAAAPSVPAFDRRDGSSFPEQEESRGLPIVPIAVSAAVVIALIFVGMRFIHGGNGPSEQESTLQQQAQQQEKLKDWPGALTTYKALAQLNGTLAADAGSQAERLQTQIAKENYLFGQAQGDSASGDLSGAKNHYQQVADLHGDREQEANDAIKKLSAAVAASATAKPAPPSKPAVAQKAPPPPAAHPSKPAPSSEASRKPVAPPEMAGAPPTVATPPPVAAKPAGNCQLIQSDIPRYLARADNNRGRGAYADAEREYNEVLQCDPENETARSGLARAKEAEAISGSH